mgnify:CR=1 FL=1
MCQGGNKWLGARIVSLGFRYSPFTRHNMLSTSTERTAIGYLKSLEPRFTISRTSEREELREECMLNWVEEPEGRCMKDKKTRREFLAKSAGAGATFFAASCAAEQRAAEQPSDMAPQEPIYKISLAQWSLHLGLFGSDPGETYGWEEFERIVKTDDYPTVLAGDIDPLDFAALAHRDFGIDAVEYVNIFFFDRAEDKAYMAELKTRAEDEGVQNVLIMCDAEGALGDPDEAARARAVENHYKWVDAAAGMGSHSIRVNLTGSSDP